MTRQELIEKIKLLKIPESIYSIDGKLIASGMILEKYLDNRWKVYHTDDHGVHTDEQVFYSEMRANDYLYELLQKWNYYFGNWK